jgi:hypothetical protein
VRIRARRKTTRHPFAELKLVASLAGNGVNISLYQDPGSGRYRVLAYGPPFGSLLPDGRRTWAAECPTAETAAATGASWARRLGMREPEKLAGALRKYGRECWSARRSTG